MPRKRLPSEKTLALLRETLDESCAEAARKIAEADVLLLCTGAGFSADSGLAIYADVARVQAYAQRGLQYHDLCQPHWLDVEPELFWGFWGQCFNDYRDTAPHDGYRIIRDWVDRKFRHGDFADAIQKGLDDAGWPESDVCDAAEPYAVEGRPSAFFAFTSNVDAHHFDWFEASEIRECHGNTEIYQCTDDCEALWRAPLDFRFTVDKATMLARAPEVRKPRKQKCGLCKGKGVWDNEVCIFCEGACFFSDDDEASASDEVVGARSPSKGSPAFNPAPRIGRVRTGDRPRRLRNMPGTAPDADKAGFRDNHPVCPHCGAPARPAILMFGDTAWRTAKEQWERWRAWKASTKAALTEVSGRPARAVILEFGAGDNVPTVRETSEAILQEWHAAGAEACLVRVNPNLPWCDSPRLRANGVNKGLVVSIMSRGLEALKKIDAAMPDHLRSGANPAC